MVGCPWGPFFARRAAENGAKKKKENKYSLLSVLSVSEDFQ
jgi:hypothetical protein